jgi:E3 ubiquitin-protein ligase UHRF1
MYPMWQQRLLFCKQCQYVTHMDCLDPPLETIPEDDWYCPDCFNDGTKIVQTGQKISYSKKWIKMALKHDYGKGYATAGKTKNCTIVSNHHFRPIPAVEVGMNWHYMDSSLRSWSPSTSCCGYCWKWQD